MRLKIYTLYLLRLFKNKTYNLIKLFISFSMFYHKWIDECDLYLNYNFG